MIYLRVSSEDQALRGTIASQADAIEQRLAREPGVVVVDRYVDEGVSGTIPLANRPDGARLVRDIAAGLIDEVWVYMVDRLGRDAVDLLTIRRGLDAKGIKLISIVEGVPDLLGFDVQAVVADHYRREFLRRSADGMNGAAREGRYTGGIVPFGYRVEGAKQHGHLVPDEEPLAGDLSAADGVRWMYRRLAVDRWSCRRIAAELNAMGVPTHYARDGRKIRKGSRLGRTRGIWRAGRIRNLVTNPVYKGDLQYGRRSGKHDREVISSEIRALLTAAEWDAAQSTLAANRLIPKNTPRVYLLRGVVTCGVCHMRYVGSQGRDGVWWYRCGGRRAERGPLDGKCGNRALRGKELDELVWADVERFLRNPGEILGELDGRREREDAEAITAAQGITLSHRLDTLAIERSGFLRLAARGSLTDAALDAELGRIDADRAEINRALTALAHARDGEPVPMATADLLAEIRSALDGGLSEHQRQEIVASLARATVLPDEGPAGPQTRLLVEYRFPDPGVGGLSTRRGRGSSPPRAETGRAG